MIKCVQENIFRYELFNRGTHIVAGVSGGPDSVCLIDILMKLEKKYSLKIIIAHVNYGLRGADSEKDEQLVYNLSEKFSLPFEVLEVGKSVAKQKNKSEESLREIRYTFFEQIRKKHKADLIAVGHNLNDQAETVLLRILRGTGLRGLGAIRFKNGNIIRPLLNISHKEILFYLRKNGVAYRIDKTNLGKDFTRNKIRNQLLPQLEKNFNPRVQNVLYKLSQTVAEDYDFINKYAAEWLKVNKSLRVSELTNLHPALQREVIRLAIEKQIPSLREIEMGHIDEVLKIIKSTKGKSQFVKFKKLKIQRKGDRLIIENI
jgi:tRNA(Ile)-lysidine synthase